MNNILWYLGMVADIRQAGKVKHLMKDIIALVFFASLANASGWEDIYYFSVSNEKYLRRYLELPNGIPSHDTIQRVFAMVSPEFLQGFQKRWNEAMSGNRGVKIKKLLAIDGKTQRGNGRGDQKANHIVSAVDENGFCLGQKKVDEKSNEITAIPDLLDDLNIKGHIVTTDALGIDREYEYEYEGLFEGFKYAKSSDYPLIINSDDATYRLLPVPTLETVEEIENYLSRCINGRNSVMEYLKENAPENYAWIQSEAPNQIHCRFTKTVSLTGVPLAGVAYESSMTLTRTVAYPHEYIHLIVPASKGYGWQYEGIADYLGWIAFQDSYYMDYPKRLVSEPDLDDMNMTFRELFYTLGGSAYNLDARKIFDAYVLFPKLYPEMSEFFNGFMTIKMSDQYNTDTPGSELTYAESASLTSYLIDQYSLDIFLSYCRDGDFEKTFGMKFEEAKDAWYAELMQRLE